ncbi:unnamed protein product, partial [Musa textilis]
YPGDKLSQHRGPCANRGILMAVSVSGPGKGGGLLERPTIEKTTPGRESEFDLKYVGIEQGSREKERGRERKRTVRPKDPRELVCFLEIHNNNCLVSFHRKSRKMAPPYRVILHNDNYNKREYVVQVLMKVIPGMTLDNAVNIMQEAHHNGLAVVIICSQADAEEHCMQLRGNGLHSSIEPASGGC